MSTTGDPPWAQLDGTPEGRAPDWCPKLDYGHSLPSTLPKSLLCGNNGDWLLSDADWLEIKVSDHRLAGVFENLQHDRWPSRGTFVPAFGAILLVDQVSIVATNIKPSRKARAFFYF
jgi:hypothetical protein